MNAKAENKISKLDISKWAAVVVLLGGGVVGNAYLAGYAVALRLIGWLVLLGITALIAFQTSAGKRVREFIYEARMELRKVVWPTRQETLQTTLIVMAVVAIAALFLWGADSVLFWLVGLLTGQRG